MDTTSDRQFYGEHRASHCIPHHCQQVLLVCQGMCQGMSHHAACCMKLHEAACAVRAQPCAISAQAPLVTPWYAACAAEFPRLVKHVDERFLSQLTELYRQRIPEGGWESGGACQDTTSCRFCFC